MSTNSKKLNPSVAKEAITPETPQESVDQVAPVYSPELALVLIAAQDHNRIFNLPLAQTDKFGTSYSSGRQVDGRIVVKVTPPDSGYQGAKDRLRFLQSERPRIKAKVDWAKRTIEEQKEAGASQQQLDRLAVSYDEWNGKLIASQKEEADILASRPEVLRDSLVSQVDNLKSRIANLNTERGKCITKAEECERFATPTVTNEDGEPVVDDRYAEAAKVSRAKAEELASEVALLEAQIEDIQSRIDEIPSFSPTTEHWFSPGDNVTFTL